MTANINEFLFLLHFNPSPSTPYPSPFAVRPYANLPSVWRTSLKFDVSHSLRFPRPIRNARWSFNNDNLVHRRSRRIFKVISLRSPSLHKLELRYLRQIDWPRSKRSNEILSEIKSATFLLLERIHVFFLETLRQFPVSSL